MSEQIAKEIKNLENTYKSKKILLQFQEAKLSVKSDLDKNLDEIQGAIYKLLNEVSEKFSKVQNDMDEIADSEMRNFTVDVDMYENKILKMKQMTRNHLADMGKLKIWVEEQTEKVSKPSPPPRETTLQDLLPLWSEDSAARRQLSDSSNPNVRTNPVVTRSIPAAAVPVAGPSAPNPTKTLHWNDPIISSAKQFYYHDPSTQSNIHHSISNLSNIYKTDKNSTIIKNARWAVIFLMKDLKNSLNLKIFDKGIFPSFDNLSLPESAIFNNLEERQGEVGKISNVPHVSGVLRCPMIIGLGVKIRIQLTQKEVSESVSSNSSSKSSKRKDKNKNKISIIMKDTITKLSQISLKKQNSLKISFRNEEISIKSAQTIKKSDQSTHQSPILSHEPKNYFLYFSQLENHYVPKGLFTLNELWNKTYGTFVFDDSGQLITTSSMYIESGYLNDWRVECQGNGKPEIFIENVWVFNKLVS